MMSIAHHSMGASAASRGLLVNNPADLTGSTTQKRPAVVRRRWRLVKVVAPVAALFLTLADPGYAGTPFYYIYAHHSNLVLMPLNHSREPGAEIVLAAPVDAGAQHWFIDRVTDIGGGQSIRRFRNRHSKLCIYVSSFQYGETLVQQPCAQPYDAQSVEWVVSNKDDMFAGWPRFFTTWSNKTDQCMDVPNGEYVEFTRLIQWPCYGTPNQEFDAEYRGTSG